MNKEQLRTIRAEELKVKEEDLIWSNKTINPYTLTSESEYSLGFWVLKT